MHVSFHTKEMHATGLRCNILKGVGLQAHLATNKPSFTHVSQPSHIMMHVRIFKLGFSVHSPETFPVGRTPDFLIDKKRSPREPKSLAISQSQHRCVINSRAISDAAALLAWRCFQPYIQHSFVSHW
jgi:hypothetical protein